MEHLEYKIEISAPARKVWETMLEEETYKQWVGKSWPNSSYKGKWETGEKIKFIGADGSGTLAYLDEVKPYQRVSVHHIAVLQKGVEDYFSDEAKGWIGTVEEYTFIEHDDDKTTLRVRIETTPEWKKMFDEGWPEALTELKRLTERQLAEA